MAPAKVARPMRYSIKQATDLPEMPVTPIRYSCDPTAANALIHTLTDPHAVRVHTLIRALSQLYICSKEVPASQNGSAS